MFFSTTRRAGRMLPQQQLSSCGPAHKKGPSHPLQGTLFTIFSYKSNLTLSSDPFQCVTKNITANSTPITHVPALISFALPENRQIKICAITPNAIP